MEDTKKAVFLGLVQGLSEFLPISSSGHLVLFQSIFGSFDDLTYEIFVHLATLFSVFTVMRTPLLQVLQLFILDLRNKKYGPGLGIVSKVFVGCLPAGFVGILFKDFLSSVFSSLTVVAYGFLLTAFLLLSTHFFKNSKTILSFQSFHGDRMISDLNRISYLQAFIIGCFQALAIVPGVSRSGTTIAGGVFLGLSGLASVYFSFFLAIPVIIGAVILQFSLETSTLSFQTLFVGFLSAYIIGVLSLWLLFKITYRGHLKWFSIYLFFLSLLIFVCK